MAKKVATEGMHHSRAWRLGWEDAANGMPRGHSENGFRTVRGDSYSEMMYDDGYNVGSCR